jgi:hypothetical protein
MFIYGEKKWKWYLCRNILGIIKKLQYTRDIFLTEIKIWKYVNITKYSVIRHSICLSTYYNFFCYCRTCYKFSVVFWNDCLTPKEVTRTTVILNLILTYTKCSFVMLPWQKQRAELLKRKKESNSDRQLRISGKK